MREILAQQTNKPWEQIVREILAWQTSNLHKKQYTRLLRNRPTYQRRNGARDFGATDKQTKEETVREILA